MEAKYEARKQELLDECTVAPQIFERVLPRLVRFMKPFVENLVRKEQCEHASTFVQGLLSNLEHKNVESIAYRFGQERMGLQWFVGTSDWDHGPLRDELVRQVGEQLGEEDGVIVFDPSGFPKSGRESVGVARQWCGRLGKVDNCQVAVCMGYVSSKEHALVDTRLFLPQEWTSDARRRACPEESAIAHAISCAWKCSGCMAEHCRTHGSQATTKWAARTGFADVWTRSTSNTCWPFRPTHRFATSKSNRRSTPVTGATRSGHGRASTSGLERSANASGPKSMCATARKARSSSRWSSVAWSRERTSGRKVTQKSWLSSVSGNVTPDTSSKPITTCPTQLLILTPWSSPAWPKPNTASKNVSSAPRAKRVWPTTRFATGRAGTTIKYSHSLPRGFW